MQEFIAEDGCPAWRADVDLQDSQKGWTFRWGVLVDSPQRTNVWGVPTEIADPNSRAQVREFRLSDDGQVERYWLTDCRRFGANKFWRAGARDPAIRFCVYAPNAKAVELVTGDAASGYIHDDGRGTVDRYPLINGGGLWSTDLSASAFASFAAWDHKPYMFRIHRDDDSWAFRTDIY